MPQRLTLIVRMQWDPAIQDWHGQVEMVNPHREVVFRDRSNLQALLEDWIRPPIPETAPTGEKETAC